MISPASLRRGAGGFTLIEIIVAFAITLLVFGALYRLSSTSLLKGSAAEELSDGLVLAQSALELFSIPGNLAEGDARDVLAGGYERFVRVKSRPDLVPNNDVAGRVFPYEVDVKVTWRDGPRTRSVALSRVVLGMPKQ